MSALIHRIVKQAYKTFSRSDSYTANYHKLSTLLTGLRAKDIALEEALDAFLLRPHGAPAGYIAIHECQYFNLCVFIVREKCSVPLHDHPEMTGLIKVLYGKAKITSYDRLDSGGCARTSLMKLKFQRRIEPIKCIHSGQYIIKDDDEVQTLQSDQDNYHSIEAVSGPTAFIDILAPPYNASQNRNCHYYIPVENVYPEEHSTDTEDDKICYLQEISPPRTFYCDPVAYRGPQIDIRDLNVDE
ncbi:2-aminoethanethiol dioxygenase [Trichoplax sp. H2]|uniref:Cysteine dioxygenase n=1 Tax=Trichoplax adhaerens TaxID=10228 RepID=B3S1K3_TRIAD|nr:hypothetical protein TRIADDRAFT_58321 [Trichoplax adhaerens]EDV23556.1 hypothetical protein TRIADDRAFT_58321 [Trichoplax adhaerens]RDD44748.1 2-aminoethanethiol dioxygenase [Trichoplax sp. H2]|eukprot:XP_002114466.1 hypothetical protein TRIADDRAFT_58321 [Trichoplax adhaerens]